MNSVKRNIVFITNPKSGTSTKGEIPELIEKRLDTSRFNYSIVQTERAGHATELATNATKEGVDIIVAVGGDGTVNEVAKAITHTSSALGIIPCGSGNGLARHLMLPMEPGRAVEIINECVIHPLDYGTINNMPFFCTCGMGFDAFISKKFAEAGKRGLITYAENVLMEGLKYKPETYEIEDENGVRTIDAYLISVANASQYGNNAYIAPQASMSDGMLDVIIMEPFDIIGAPQISIDMFNKTLDKNSKIRTFRTKKIHIKRSKPGLIHYDGDPITTGEDLEIAIQEKGINVIVNPFADKTQRQPNLVQTALSTFFNELNILRDNLSKQGMKVQELNKMIIKKLNLQ